MAKRPNYTGLFKVANKLTLGKCECGKDIVVDVELTRDEDEAEESPKLPEANMAKEAAVDEDVLDDEDEDGEDEDAEDEDGFSHLAHFFTPEVDADSEVVSKKASNENTFNGLVKKASSIIDQLDSVANQVESNNPRLAARIDAVSNEIEKRVARLLQRRQNTK